MFVGGKNSCSDGVLPHCHGELAGSLVNHFA